MKNTRAFEQMFRVEINKTIKYFKYRSFNIVFIYRYVKPNHDFSLYQNNTISLIKILNYVQKICFNVFMKIPIYSAFEKSLLCKHT